MLQPYKELIFGWTGEVVPDLLEIGIERLFSEGILSSFPAVKIVMSTGVFLSRVSKCVREKHVLVFAQQLNRNELTQKKVKKHLEKLNKRPKKKFQELEILVNSISQHGKYIKDQILANFYLLYCDQDVDFSYDRVAMLRLRNIGLVEYYDTAPNTVYTCSKENFTARITSAGEFFLEEGMKGIVLHHKVEDEERIL